MKNLSILFLAFFTVTLISCKDNSTDTSKEPELEIETVDNSADSKEIYKIAETEAKFKDPNVEAIFNQYLVVEAALVNTNPDIAKAESSKMQTMISDFGGHEKIRIALEEMANSSDIQTQRQSFENVSGGMEVLLEGALESGTLYKQYCPMAFNNRGASWISSSKDILNPYFGDKMLKCGRVDSEIQ